jgi:hypothetical protein
MDEAQATAIARKLISLLVNADYQGFLDAIDCSGNKRKSWINSVSELTSLIESHGCDLENPGPPVLVTDPESAEGEPWSKGPFSAQTFPDGITRVHCELAINGEWTDYHIYFDFIPPYDVRPVVSFVGIP